MLILRAMLNPLEQFRSHSGKSKAELGRSLGYCKANPSRFYERIETGEVPADADIIDRIVKVTGGAVSVGDMHSVRLAWLRANRPDRFPEPAE